MLNYIKANNGLKGNGMAYYIDGYDQYKFKLSNFQEKFNTIPEFRELITNTARQYLRASIKESDNLKIAEAQLAEKTEIENFDE